HVGHAALLVLNRDSLALDHHPELSATDGLQRCGATVLVCVVHERGPATRVLSEGSTEGTPRRISGAGSNTKPAQSIESQSARANSAPAFQTASQGSYPSRRQ